MSSTKAEINKGTVSKCKIPLRNNPQNKGNPWIRSTYPIRG
jgi:hypothetical protein